MVRSSAPRGRVDADVPVGACREHASTARREVHDGHWAAGREHAAQPGRAERLPQHRFGTAARGDTRGGDRIGDRTLRIGRELDEGRRVQGARTGPSSRAPGVGALSERVDGDRRHRCQPEQSQSRDDDEAPLVLARPLSIPLQLATDSPGEDAVGEDVVEDLVPLASSRPVDRTHDALAAEDVQHRHDVGLANGRVLGEVTRPVGDLRPRGRDEVVEHRRRDVLLGRRQPRQRPLEMNPHDRLGASELLERRQAENRRPALSLDLPEALQDELEVWRLDPRLVRRDTAAARSADVDLAGGDLIEHGLDELRLDANLLVR